jgi:hypothetical protein
MGISFKVTKLDFFALFACTVLWARAEVKNGTILLSHRMEEWDDIFLLWNGRTNSSPSCLATIGRTYSYSAAWLLELPLRCITSKIDSTFREVPGEARSLLETSTIRSKLKVPSNK